MLHVCFILPCMDCCMCKRSDVQAFCGVTQAIDLLAEIGKRITITAHPKRMSQRFTGLDLDISTRDWFSPFSPSAGVLPTCA
jgi:hypothetical protein